MNKLSVAALFAMAAIPIQRGETQIFIGNPQNLGSPINTPAIEVGPNLSADELTLYFVSHRPGGRSGAPELWVSTRRTPLDDWSPPVNLGQRSTAILPRHRRFQAISSSFTSIRERRSVRVDTAVSTSQPTIEHCCSCPRDPGAQARWTSGPPRSTGAERQVCF